MNSTQFPIASEFDIIRPGKGFTMKGWDFTSAEVAAALAQGRMLNTAFELGSNVCPRKCPFCFTEAPDNMVGTKRRLEGEMEIEERTGLIDEAAALGARSINFVGAGEPTIDQHFFEIVKRISDQGMVPIIYSEGALMLKDAAFAADLYALGATVVLKVNSLWNREYQNAVVGGGPGDYFAERNRALEVLMAAGFNRHDPTSLAVDTIMCKENLSEIPGLHRFARENNIFLMLVDFIPAGRSSNPIQNMVSDRERLALLETIARMDVEDYGISHRTIFPYSGGVPCTIRGLGLYVKIQGDAWDCPGETERLGNVRQQSLKELWEKAAHVRNRFDGRCLPKERFREQHSLHSKRRLPTIR